MVRVVMVRVVMVRVVMVRVLMVRVVMVRVVMVRVLMVRVVGTHWSTACAMKRSASPGYPLVMATSVSIIPNSSGSSTYK